MLFAVLFSDSFQPCLNLTHTANWGPWSTLSSSYHNTFIHKYFSIKFSKWQLTGNFEFIQRSVVFRVRITTSISDYDFLAISRSEIMLIRTIYQGVAAQRKIHHPRHQETWTTMTSCLRTSVHDHDLLGVWTTKKNFWNFSSKLSWRTFLVKMGLNLQILWN